MQPSQPQKMESCCPLAVSSIPAGHGSRNGAEQTCTTCHGTGWQVHMQQIIPGMMQQMSIKCQSCKGKGKKISFKDRCKACAGRQIVRKKKVQKVCVSKGAVRKNRGDWALTQCALTASLSHWPSSQAWKTDRRLYSKGRETRSRVRSRETSSSSWNSGSIHVLPGDSLLFLFRRATHPTAALFWSLSLLSSGSGETCSSQWSCSWRRLCVDLKSLFKLWTTERCSSPHAQVTRHHLQFWATQVLLISPPLFPSHSASFSSPIDHNWAVLWSQGS